ncbi:enoyl-CoA hydratase/isomerase family protein [Nocardia amamiensis]|uniref:Enoyl-CoA hydratase/isomerase family protein n=1 Tax=Nocardia amamiensis TaxID=404578 RepID=A0ABS0CY25_9NOCA|nr:enoyl-CoA hydratase/isomerase family protein [Nocardia amamiensis]MBF6301491.1 enoyl-CoA hydratase/isomerase family protein [Nocardia amamiensis]
MADYSTISYEVDGPVASITLNRPDKYNAINRTMAAELLAVFRRVRDEDGVSVVVLAGAGRGFCTGGDLDIFPSLADHTAALNWLAHEGYEIGKAIELCEKVVIAKIHGHCLAGGLELALMCDLVYATDSARFGATEINMGLLPGWGGTVRIARAMPLHRAREVIYSGRKDYTARDFYEMGLLTRVFDADRFEERFAETVANIAGKKAIALRMGKEVLARSLETPSLDTALALERNAIQWLNHAPDIQAAMAMFREIPDALVKSQRAANVDSDQKA